MKKQPHQLDRDNRIAKVVAEKSAAGVPVQEIFASIQNYQKAPKSLTTFYKYYREDMDKARGEVTEKIANVVIKKAIVEKDLKAAELWLTTKGGWNKNQNVNVFDATEDPNAKSSALDSLLGKLGFNNKEDEE